MHRPTLDAPPALAAVLALAVALALAACADDDVDRMNDATPAGDIGPDPADATTDTANGVDAAPDTMPDVIVDAMVDASDGIDGAIDAMRPPPPRCSMPPAQPLTPDGPLPPATSPHRGIDALEAPAWATLRDGLMASPGVHFVATYDHALDAYVIEGGPVGARARLVVRRVDGENETTLEIVSGALEDIFPSTQATRHGDYAQMLDALENPDGVAIADRGYAEGDPRVGWLTLDAQSWPDPLVRLTTIFDAADAPDALVGVWPWANGGTGSHGGLGLLQSQAAFVISGAGARRGVVLDRAARLVDAAPTALAALGIPTTGGVGPDGTYADGLYLTRQDGAVRWEALDPDPCVRPNHVVLILFDGLQATEINHLMLADDPPVDLPTFREIAAEGTVYRYGAVVGFPSMSAPGHATAGTGAWPGHHGIVGNGFFGRAEQAEVTPFAVLSDLPAFLGEPQRLYDLLDRIFSGDAETVSEAMHRALGGDTFTAVINEITIGGADHTPLDHFGIEVPKASVDDSERVDGLGQLMIEALLGDSRRPVPELLQLSLLSTDAAGENAGPHSELVREALVTLDGRLAAIRAAYARRGALDRTMFILVSDHGMELTDPTRRASVNTAIRDTGIKTRYFGSGGIWLATLAVDAERTDDGIDVIVTAHDNGSPVEGATVRCDGCGFDVVEGGGVTDADGRVTLMVGPGATPEAIAAQHPTFNPQTVSLAP